MGLVSFGNANLVAFVLCYNRKYNGALFLLSLFRRIFLGESATDTNGYFTTDLDSNGILVFTSSALWYPCLSQTSSRP